MLMQDSLVFVSSLAMNPAAAHLHHLNLEDLLVQE